MCLAGIVCVRVSACTSICMQTCVCVCDCVHVEQQLRAGVGIAAVAAAVAAVGVLCVFGCACCQFAVCQQ